MPIKPIDMQINLPKTQQVSKIQQTDNEKMKNVLHNQENLHNNIIEKELHQVNSTKKTSHNKINKESQKNNQNKERKNNNNNTDDNKDDKHEEKYNNILGSNIDIKI